MIRPLAGVVAIVFGFRSLLSIALVARLNAMVGLYLRNAGIAVYGVSGPFYGDTVAHGMNERIPVESFSWC